MLRYLRESDEAAYFEAAVFLLEEGDVHTAFRAASDFARHAPWPRTLALLERWKLRLGELAQPMLDVLSESRRQAHLIQMRRQIRNPDHRFLLALLLNLPTWEAVKAMIRARRPEADPTTTFLGWLSEMAQDARQGLGFRLDPVRLEVLRLRLEGAPAAQIVERLRGNFGQEAPDRATVSDLLTAYELSYLFQRLLAVYPTGMRG
jgi:hypothetical protein